MARNNEPPTTMDFQSVSGLNMQAKAKALYMYLYGDVTNMQSVGEILFNGDGSSASMVPSAIMRCYGFSGMNGNYYKKRGFKLTEADFVAFVKKYPYGCNGDWPDHETIDEFMRKRHEANCGQQTAEEDDYNNGYNELAYDDEDYSGNEYYGNQGYSQSGGGFLSVLGGLLQGLGNNRSGASGKITWKHIALLIGIILVIIYRRELWSLIIALLPYLIIIAIAIFLFTKLINGDLSKLFKGGSKRGGRGRKKASTKHFDSRGIIPCGILWVIGIGGLMNGASASIGGLILGIGLLAAGVLCIYHD